MLARAARAAARKWGTGDVVVMAMDAAALSKLYDKGIKAMTGHHLDQTGDKTRDRLALKD